MRMLWRTFLALALGMLVSGAYAQQVAWKASSAQPAAPLGAPIATSRPSPASPPPAAAPAAVIGRPIAVASSRPDAPSATAPVVRGSSPGTADRPLAGPLTPVIYPGLHSWRRADEGITLASRTMAATSSQLPQPTLDNAPLAPIPAPPPLAGPMPVGPPPVGSPNFAPPVGPPTFAPPPPPTHGPVLMPPALGAPSPYATAPGQPCGPTCSTCPAPACPTCCDNAGCGCLPHVCPPGNIWFVGIEYLAWCMKGDGTPVLAATVPAPGSGPVPLFGGDNLGTDVTSGARLTLGLWFSSAHYWGAEISAFFLGDRDDNFNATSISGVPNVIRPFIDVGPFTADRLSGRVIANPAVGGPAFERVADNASSGPLSGMLDVKRTSNLWGAEFNLKRGIVCCENGYVDLLFGYRSLGMDESLTITEELTTTSINPRQAFRVQDRFETSNRFYGGQIGLDSEYRAGCWSFGLRGKVAFGNNQQMAELTGSTTRRVGSGPPATLPGGLLVQNGTNQGRYFRESFGIVPEIGFTLGYQLAPWCRATVGYNFLYWSNVLRPGGTIDPSINTAYLPFAPINPSTTMNGVVAGNPVRPAFIPNTSDFWAQGLTLGLEFRW